MKKRVINSLSPEQLRTCAALLYDIVDPTCEQFHQQIEIAQNIFGLTPPRPVPKRLLKKGKKK